MQSLATGGFNERWLSVDEISAYLGVKRDTVYKWIDRKRLPAHKVGRLWKFRKWEVDNWVCSDKSTTHAKTGRSMNGEVGPIER